MSVHPTAIIDPTAEISPEAVIEPYAIVGPQSKIGPRCRLMPHSVVYHTELGEGCVVYPGASLGLEPQHLKDPGEGTILKVGKGSIFRESVTVHRGTRLDKGVTSIGDNCFLMAYSHVAHDCVLGNEVILANAAQLAGHCVVGDQAFLSATACLHQHVRVGSGALVSGGSMVSLDVAPFTIAQGDRASLKGLNVIGLRRRGAKRENLKKLKDAYKTVFHQNRSLQEALETPALKENDPWVVSFKEFLTQSKRGFTRPGEDSPKEEALSL